MENQTFVAVQAVWHDATDEENPFLIPSPSNRGKFSKDRETWDRIHHLRYAQWQLGDAIETIAMEHGVTYNAIKNSIRWCEARLRIAEVTANRNQRLKLRTIATLDEKYVVALERLISDKNPMVRLKALEQLRKTIGGDQPGVHVNTQVNVGASDGSFEERLERIRTAQEDSERLRIGQPSTPKLLPACGSCAGTSNQSPF